MNIMVTLARLTKEVETRISKNGDRQTTIARFSIAVPKVFKREGEPDANFYNCVAFGKTAELLEKYIHKGDQVLFTGHMDNNNWTDKEGRTHYDLVYVIDKMDFVGNKRSNNDNGENRPSAPASVTDGFMNIPDGVDDSGLPFN